MAGESNQPPDLSAVPLFPLPNVVLFPRAVLPLHIFEERYKAMTAEVLAGSGRIAMALLKPGWEKCYYHRPAIEPVVCVGLILTHERLRDGTYNFLLQGQSRARIIREDSKASYRVAELSELEESSVLEIELADERQRLINLFEESSLLATGIGRQFRQLLAGPLPTADAADLIAFNFLEDIQLKQSLLSDVNVRQRVRRTIEAFESVHSALLPASLLSEPQRGPNLN